MVDLSRNFGKEAALTAGMRIAKGQLVVPIDVDLQAPPELIFEMIGQWRQGYDVVLARRVGRDTDSRIKRISTTWFYRIYNRIAEPMIPEDVSDFRLMDCTVVDALNGLPESRRFMKGLFAWVGFRTTCVDYTCPKRAAGSSKFNGRRLWNFALEGVTSFSTVPLRIWTYLGATVALASFLYASLIVLKVLIFGGDTPVMPRCSLPLPSSAVSSSWESASSASIWGGPISKPSGGRYFSSGISYEPRD